MTTEASRVLAMAFAALWIAGGVLALNRRRTAAALANGLIALPICVLAGWPLVRTLVDLEGYVRQYGRAALNELPLTAALLALSAAALVASVLSVRRSTWVFAAGWLANAPALLLLVYLAFWFRIF